VIFQKYSSTLHEAKTLAWLISSSAQFYWPEEILVSQLKKTSCFVAEEAGAVAAVASFQKLNETVWELQLIAVKPESRGRGLAERLFRWALQELCVLNESHLTAEIWLEVHEQNQAALALYRRMGFQQMGQRPRYYRDGGAAFSMTLKPGALISS
jgi:ribosomal protein S18 acetylase RimI-like enzyme